MCGTAMQQAQGQAQTEVFDPINRKPFSAVALASGSPLAPLFMNSNKGKEKNA